MIFAIPLFSLGLAALSEQIGSTQAPAPTIYGGGGPYVRSPYYGAYDARYVYGANRLAEIEEKVLNLVRRYVKAWNIPKLISLNKQRDRLILSGTPPSDPEVIEIEEKAESLLPGMPEDERLELERLKAQRDELLLENIS